MKAVLNEVFTVLLWALGFYLIISFALWEWETEHWGFWPRLIWVILILIKAPLNHEE